jgi:hypothetical protein
VSCLRDSVKAGIGTKAVIGTKKVRFIGSTLSLRHSLNDLPHPFTSSAKQGPLTETQGPEDQGRQGGKSAKPPPVSSVVASKISDQCLPEHVAADCCETEDEDTAFETPASAMLGTPAIAPIIASPDRNPAMAELMVDSGEVFGARRILMLIPRAHFDVGSRRRRR